MKFLFCGLMLTLSPASYAFSLDCSSESLSYHLDIADGGAPRLPIEILVLNNETLIRSNGFESEEVRMASLELLDQPIETSSNTLDDYMTTGFTQRAIVKGNAPTDSLAPILFNDMVKCVSVSYVGREPRP